MVAILVQGPNKNPQLQLTVIMLFLRKPKAASRKSSPSTRNPTGASQGMEVGVKNHKI